MSKHQDPLRKHVDSFDRRRLVIVSFVIFLFFCLLIVQFYKVQILEGEKWKKIGQLQHSYLVKEPFMRGRFFSNTSIKKHHPEEEQPFVIDIPKFHLFADSLAIEEKYRRQIVSKLCKYCYLTKKQEGKVLEQFYRKSRSRKLVAWLDKDIKDKINLWWQGFAKANKIQKNALFFVEEYKRSYPFGPLLGQILHTVQEEKDINTFQNIPTGGMEMYFNKHLQGKMGGKLILRSPKHQLGKIKVISHSENGADIYLTINHYLQAIMEEELAKGIEKVKAKGGWAIMMEPKTGHIWALAQYPPFDPRNYQKYFNDNQSIEHTKVKAVMDAFEPGSIFKPITLAICFIANEELERVGRKPLFSPEEMIAVSDGKFPGRTRPLRDGRLHRYLNMDLAIQKSSNVYMGKLIQRVIKTFGDEWYKNKLIELGFGKKTNIELPAETPGLVPTPGKFHPNGKLEWSLSTPYSLAMGHNILANSIQVLRCFAIIANKGLDVKPTLVRKIVKENRGETTILLDNTKTEENIRIINKASAERIMKAMKYTTKIGGTARLGDIMGYSEAGKSGTSEKIINGQYSKSKYISSFVGIAPANDPKFILMIVIDEPEVKFVANVGKTYHGGVCAAPIFKEIAFRSLQYLGVAPDDPFGYPYGDKRRNIEKADWVYQVDELKKIYSNWNTTK